MCAIHTSLNNRTCSHQVFMLQLKKTTLPIRANPLIVALLVSFNHDSDLSATLTKKFWLPKHNHTSTLEVADYKPLVGYSL